MWFRFEESVSGYIDMNVERNLVDTRQTSMMVGTELTATPVREISAHQNKPFPSMIHDQSRFIRYYLSLRTSLVDHHHHQFVMWSTGA